MIEVDEGRREKGKNKEGEEGERVKKGVIEGSGRGKVDK